MSDRLTLAQRRALEGIDVLYRSGGVDMATLRANGHRRDVVDRLCALGLAYAAGGYGDRERVRFDLTNRGRQALTGASR